MNVQKMPVNQGNASNINTNNTLPQDTDPIVVFKNLLPKLKESLSNLMQVAAQALHINAQYDSMIRPADGTTVRFDKELEEFYGLCDSIEVALRLALDAHTQHHLGSQYSPVAVQNLPRPDTPQPNNAESLTFSQYCKTVYSQLNSCKEVHDSLVECVRGLDYATTANAAVSQKPLTANPAATLTSVNSAPGALAGVNNVPGALVGVNSAPGMPPMPHT